MCAILRSSATQLTSFQPKPNNAIQLHRRNSSRDRTEFPGCVNFLDVRTTLTGIQIFPGKFLSHSIHHPKFSDFQNDPAKGTHFQLSKNTTSRVLKTQDIATNETWQDTENKVKHLITSHMPEVGGDIVIERAHRVGKPRSSAESKPRKIVARFLNYKDRESVLKAKKSYGERMSLSTKIILTGS